REGRYQRCRECGLALPLRRAQGRCGEGAGVAPENRQGPTCADDGGVRAVRRKGETGRGATGRRGRTTDRGSEERATVLRPPLPGALPRGAGQCRTGAKTPRRGNRQPPRRPLHVGRGTGPPRPAPQKVECVQLAPRVALRCLNSLRELLFAALTR